MADPFGSDDKQTSSGEASRVRVSETDLAILAALCRQYIDGKPFPAIPPNNTILEELAANEIFLDLDTLRGHLRNLYAKFGVEEGLTAAEKRVRLAELVHGHGVIPGWNDSAAANRKPRPEDATSAGPSPPIEDTRDASPPIDEEATPAASSRVIATVDPMEVDIRPCW